MNESCLLPSKHETVPFETARPEPRARRRGRLSGARNFCVLSFFWMLSAAKSAMGFTPREAEAPKDGAVAHEGHAPSVTEPRAMGFASQVRPLAARRALAPRRARPTCSGRCACSAACSSAAPLVDTAVHPGRRHRPSRPAGPAEVRPAPTHARAPPEHLESLPWPQQLASGRPNV